MDLGLRLKDISSLDTDLGILGTKIRKEAISFLSDKGGSISRG